MTLSLASSLFPWLGCCSVCLHPCSVDCDLRSVSTLAALTVICVTLENARPFVRVVAGCLEPRFWSKQREAQPRPEAWLPRDDRNQGHREGVRKACHATYLAKIATRDITMGQQTLHVPFLCTRGAWRSSPWCFFARSLCQRCFARCPPAPLRYTQGGGHQQLRRALPS